MPIDSSKWTPGLRTEFMKFRRKKSLELVEELERRVREV